MNHTTRKEVSITDILAALNKALVSSIKIKYKLNSRKHKADLVTEFAERLQTLTVYELSNELEEIVGEFYDECVNGDIREGDYTIRRHENHIDMNPSGYILFDSDEGIKSVLPLNIISVEVDGVMYER